jgi:hypothetical protein
MDHLFGKAAHLEEAAAKFFEIFVEMSLQSHGKHYIKFFAPSPRRGGDLAESAGDVVFGPLFRGLRKHLSGRSEFHQLA